MDPKKKKFVYIRFCLLQLTYWGCFATFTSYFVALMLANGMSSTTASLIQAVYLLTAFLGSFLWGSVSDRMHTNRKTFLIQLALVLIFANLIYQFRQTHWLVAVLYPVLGFSLVPVASNLDSWIIKSFPENPNYYGVTRAVSAIGFGVLALVMGQLVGRVGYHVMPYGLTFMAVSSLVLAFLQPDSPTVGVRLSERLSVKDIGGLFKIRPYVILLITLLLAGLAIVPISYMKLLFYQSVGGTVQWVGYESMVGCCVQFPIFLAAGKMKMIPTTTRMLIAVLGILLMLIFYFAGRAPIVLLCGAIFYFIGYSILLPTYREMGMRIIEGKLMTTAQSLLDAVFGSLAGMTGLFYAGYVIDNLGTRTMVGINLAVLAIPLFLVVSQFIKARRER